jgi:hypothetical protein
VDLTALADLLGEIDDTSSKTFFNRRSALRLFGIFRDVFDFDDSRWLRLTGFVRLVVFGRHDDVEECVYEESLVDNQ